MQRLKFLGLAIPLAALAVVLQAQSGGPASTPTPIVLEAIDPNWFSDTGEEFFVPFPGEKAAVTDEEVRVKLKEIFGDTPIRQLVLTHAIVPAPTRFPPLDQLVWLASLDMSDNAAPDTSAHMLMYALAYFDAQTGESIYGAEAWLPKEYPPPAVTIPTLAPGDLDVPEVPKLP